MSKIDPPFDYAPASEWFTLRFAKEASRDGYSVDSWCDKTVTEAYKTHKLFVKTPREKRLFKFRTEQESDRFHDFFDQTVAAMASVSLISSTEQSSQQ